MIRRKRSPHAGEGHDPLGVGGLLGVDPPQSPVSLPLDRRDGLDGVEEVLPLRGVLHVGVDEEAVHLTVDVLNGDLEAIEAPCFWNLNILQKSFNQIFVDNAI
eukprot:TRINITY_DN5772_c0_g1_i1.p2 TRINITY_DN5772_c0_g1~~TRINITY_DN5772_c0_g1_i1.p2  ORF type:complete len:103 (+),score=18.65 TRINITY_DN5772_c0_g1_i1:264-572(+)